MRILLADRFPDAHLDALRAAGHECLYEPQLGADELADQLAGVDVLVVRSTRVNRDAVAASTDLGLIVRAGAGTNTIDTQAAADAGIYVSNVPGRNAIAVAELAMGLLIAIDRHIPEAVADLRSGRWDKARYGKADGLYGKRLGIVGLGRIGLALAERAASFGIEVMAVNKARRSEAAARVDALGIRLLPDLDALVEASDIVSLHVPASASTERLVDADFLARMRPGAILLNTSRGEVVDADALIDAMDQRGIRAGLDVYPDEPAGGSGAFDSRLAGHPNVVGTHHIGASTTQAQQATADGVIEVIEAYASGSAVNCVNLETARLGSASLTVRHYDKVGVLAQVFDVLRRAGINVETMQNNVFSGSRAAVAQIDVGGTVGPDVESDVAAIPDVIRVVVNQPHP